MKKITDIFYGSNENQCLDIYLPDCAEFSVFVYFHGGGIELGDKSEQKLMCEYLCERGVAVVNANYRMYPEASYPDFLEDAASAIAWAFENMKNYGKVKGIYVGGSSAGGYISQMLCFDNRWLAEFGISPIQIAGFVHDAGQPTAHFNVLKYRGIDSRRVIVDETAPLYHIGEAAEYSPMLIIVSDNDMENRYEQTTLLISTLKHFGYEGERVKLQIMNGKHCAYVNAADEKGDSVFGKLIYDFIKGV